MSDHTAKMLPPRFDGVLVVGHGTREPAGQAEFHAALVRLAALRPAWIVEGAFLELAQPTIAAGLAALVRRGARSVRALPLLLFAAGHAKHDIPEALARAAADHPGVEIEQLSHLGCHEKILQLSALRFRQSLVGRRALTAGETGLLMVGRGSNDPEATAEMLALATLRTDPAAVGHSAAAFVAMAQPRLDEVLNAARSWPCRRIVVQPHLLFSGLLLAEIQEKVARAAQGDASREWIVTAHLGPDEALAAAMADLISGTSAVEI